MSPNGALLIFKQQCVFGCRRLNPIHAWWVNFGRWIAVVWLDINAVLIIQRCGRRLTFEIIMCRSEAHTQAHTLTSGSFWCWMEEQGLLGEWSSCSDQFSAWPSEAQHSALALQPQLCCFPPQASSWGNNGQIHHQSSHPYNHEKIINHNDNESYLTLTTFRSSRDWNL